MFKFVLLGSCVVMMSCGGESGTKTEETTTTVAPVETTTPAEPAPAPAAAAFSKTVDYGKIKVSVSSPNTASDNSYVVKTEGLTASNMNDEKFSTTGAVTDVLIDDIDGDNSPEFFVISRPAGGGLAKVDGYSTFGGKSWGMINFPDQSSNPDVSGAFKDGDEYMPVENTFVMRFPVYENGAKTGKTRQLQFKLKAGEAMKQLVLDKKTEY